ncbi:hypothetical protein D9758_014705 [Tetrapyrgos nigripes]|uniref:Uncharacterized protein n=1 Tax=Tetrapyrgos nigripes TaxID=182062 RepID=A0A8H5FIU1_9AGAR|nr:hypothetical protein D9758_014705 [Tetrapyrgos nigripes]
MTAAISTDAQALKPTKHRCVIDDEPQATSGNLRLLLQLSPKVFIVLRMRPDLAFPADAKLSQSRYPDRWQWQQYPMDVAERDA